MTINSDKQEVTVKPLVWKAYDWNDDDAWSYYADTVFGQFDHGVDKFGQPYWAGPDFDHSEVTGGDVETEEIAKASAQEHYNRLVSHEFGIEVHSRNREHSRAGTAARTLLDTWDNLQKERATDHPLRGPLGAFFQLLDPAALRALTYISDHFGSQEIDDRMIEAGMIPLSQMMQADQLAKWKAHAGVNDIDSFKAWVDKKRSQFMNMRMAYELGDEDKDDDLYEWVFAHSATFEEVAENLGKALDNDAELEPVKPPSV